MTRLIGGEYDGIEVPLNETVKVWFIKPSISNCVLCGGFPGDIEQKPEFDRLGYHTYVREGDTLVYRK